MCNEGDDGIPAGVNAMSISPGPCAKRLQHPYVQPTFSRAKSALWELDDG